MSPNFVIIFGSVLFIGVGIFGISKCSIENSYFFILSPFHFVLGIIFTIAGITTLIFRRNLQKYLEEKNNLKVKT